MQQSPRNQNQHDWRLRLQGVALALLALLFLATVWVVVQIVLGFAAIVRYG